MSAFPSLISPLMNAQGLITTSALNTEAQTALALSATNAADIVVLQDTALQASSGLYTGLASTNCEIFGKITAHAPDKGDAFVSTGFRITDTGKLYANSLTTAQGAGVFGEALVGLLDAQTINAGNSNQFRVDISGNCTVNELTYTTLNPPIAPGATPSLSQVLAISGDGGNQPITNVENLYVNNVINTAVRIETNQVSILNDGGTGYHIMDSNASGVDLNTKFTSDGLILHKVSTGSDITIQNDANNLVTLGTAAGYADLQVGILNYLELNPPIAPSATPTLDEVLEAGNDGGARSILNISNIVATDSLQILKDADQPELGNYYFSSAATGFSVGAGASLTANTLIGGSPDGIAFQNANASFKANFDGSVDCGNITCELINGVAPEFKPTYNYYVSKNGNDTNGLGSILSPYATIQKAISVCEAVYDGTPRVINVLAGTYTENLTLTKSRISIVGEGQSSRPDVGTSISGTITITITSGNSDLNNNNIYFSGLLLGQIEDNTASTSYPHRVFFTNCQLYANNRVLYMHPAGDFRAFVSNCVISNDDTAATDPIVECYSSSTGMVSFTSNQITSKGTSQNVFKLSGSCRIDTYAQNLLTSDSTGTNVAIAIFVHSSTATISIGQCAFIYSSANPKRNIDTASGIYMASGSGSLVIVQNFFSLSGLPSGQNAVLNSGSSVVLYGNNISSSSAAGTSAFAISGTQNVNKFSFTSLQ